MPDADGGKDVTLYLVAGRRGRRQRSTTSSSGSGRGSSRRAGRTCCCATCPRVARELAARRERVFAGDRQDAWPRPARPARATRRVRRGRAGPQARRRRPTMLAAWLDYLGIGAGGGS